MKDTPKKKKTVRRRIDDFVDKLEIIVFALFFLLGMYSFADTYSVYSASQDTSLLTYKPAEGELLQPELTDNVAWLTLDDTTVDYPIMQGTNNDDYLDTDPYGNYSLSGSIFLDYRCSPNFEDTYNLVYGHHMEKGLMFGSLDDWLDEDYFNSHKTGTITTANRIYSLQVVAVMEERATVNELFQPTDVDPSKTLEFIKQNAVIYDDSVELTHVVALSTCKYPDTDDRTVVICEMTLTYQGNNTELDQTKHQELQSSQTQVGTRIYSKVEPIEYKKDWIDWIAELFS